MNDLGKGSPFRLTAATAAEDADGRKHRSQKSQARIVNAMLELVAQGNLEPSADQIADIAKVGRRSVFRHFSDMDTLYREMNKSIAATMGSLVQQPFQATDWRCQVLELVDPVGDRWAEPALRAIRWGGRFVTVGYAGGDIPRIPLTVVLLKNITVRGLELRTWTERLTEETANAMEALTQLVAQGMRPAVSEVHELDDVAAALQRVFDRVPTGKVVIRVAP